jgi:hypothetical protein
LQRRICDVLYAAENGELPLRELRRRLGEPDRSNVRRAIRGLLEREIVEESDSGGEHRVGLTVWSYIGMSVRPMPPEGLSTSRTASREQARAAEDGPDVGLEAARRGRQAGTVQGPGGLGYEYPSRLNPPLGETQRTILGALRRYAKLSQVGLPLTLLRALVGADRSNFRRAVRTLLLRGLLEESEDGRRVRLTHTGALAASSLS